MLKVKVDRLNIQLNGISYQIAKSIVNDLGKDLFLELAKRSQTYHRNRHNFSTKINEIDLGILKTEENSISPHLKETIVGHVADGISNAVQKRTDGKVGVR